MGYKSFDEINEKIRSKKACLLYTSVTPHRDHAHALHPSGDNHFGEAAHDPLGGNSDRLQPGGAKAVYRLPGHRIGEAGF